MHKSYARLYVIKRFLTECIYILYSEGTAASTTVLPPATGSPPGNGTFACTYSGDIRSYFNQTSSGPLNQHEGMFDICIGGFYGSVCDIGWNEEAAQTFCRGQFGSNFGMLFVGFLHYYCA